MAGAFVFRAWRGLKWLHAAGRGYISRSGFVHSHILCHDCTRGTYTLRHAEYDTEIRRYGSIGRAFYQVCPDKYIIHIYISIRSAYRCPIRSSPCPIPAGGGKKFYKMYDRKKQKKSIVTIDMTRCKACIWAVFATCTQV